jgi:cytochrome c
MSLWGLVPMVVVLTACGSLGGSERSAGAAAAERGRVAMKAWGCGSCHVIPGVRGANGMVGPSLERFAQRAYIAGRLPNQPDNLERWIEDPQGVDSLTAMPDLDVVPTIAADMAAYLYTLR